MKYTDIGSWSSCFQDARALRKSYIKNIQGMHSIQIIVVKENMVLKTFICVPVCACLCMCICHGARAMVHMQRLEYNLNKLELST